MLTNVLYSGQAAALVIRAKDKTFDRKGEAVTEDEARAICADLGATLSIRKRKGIPYVYVARWLPRAAVEAAGWKTSKSRGQQFDRYVTPLARLDQVSAETLRQRIAELPRNPNKQDPASQYLDRSTPQLARWHAETHTPEHTHAARPFRPAARRKGRADRP